MSEAALEAHELQQSARHTVRTDTIETKRVCPFISSLILFLETQSASLLFSLLVLSIAPDSKQGPLALFNDSVAREIRWTVHGTKDRSCSRA